MKEIKSEEIDRIRLMANGLDCLIEEDFQLLAGATANTVEAWRKRGQGPAYVLLGNRYLYPRKAVVKHQLSTSTADVGRSTAAVKQQ